MELQGVDDGARRELWRFLLGIDWTDGIAFEGLAVDDPLLLLVDRPNELRPRVFDGLWVRPVDVGGALAARGLAGDGRVTLEVTADPQFADNVGTWTVEGDRVRRTSRRPDVRLDVQGLGIDAARWVHVRATRPCGSGGGGRSRRPRARRRAVPGAAGTLVPGDLLASAPCPTP